MLLTMETLSQLGMGVGGGGIMLTIIKMLNFSINIMGITASLVK